MCTGEVRVANRRKCQQWLFRGEGVKEKTKRKRSGSNTAPDHARDIADLAALLLSKFDD